MNAITENKVADFKIDIPIRIYDINYGGHLGHSELIKITHEARVKFFSKFSLKESDIDGAGIIVRALVVNYLGEAFFEDLLHISIFINKIGKTSCDFFYEITKNTGQPVATVIETVLFMNYVTRRIQRVPKVIHDLKNTI